MASPALICMCVYLLVLVVVSCFGCLESRHPFFCPGLQGLVGTDPLPFSGHTGMVSISLARLLRNKSVHSPRLIHRSRHRIVSALLLPFPGFSRVARHDRDRPSAVGVFFCPVGCAVIRFPFLCLQANDTTGKAFASFRLPASPSPDQG